MALLSAVNTALKTLVSNALTAAGVAGFQLGTEWPPKDVLENAGNDATPIIAILHKMTTYQSKNMRFQHSVTVAPVGIVSTLSDTSFTPGQSVTITISYATGSSAVNVGDMISFGISDGDTNNAASTTAASGATLATMATALAAAIHTAMPTINATASGAVITITNADTVGYRTTSHVGNTTAVAENVKWASRSMQINVWCGDLATKFSIQQAIENLLATTDDAQGFALASTEWISLKFHGAKPIDGDTDKDVYTDVYLFEVDHMVDASLEMWSVVATNPQTP